MKFITGNKFPKLLGADFCGQVLQSKNKKFKKGDVLFGMLNPMKGGACAEQIVIDEKNCSLKPDNLSEYESAVVPLIGLTCYTALIAHGNIQKNQKVFINGCTGGVGSFAVQMANSIGAEVTGTCSDQNAEYAKTIGAQHVIDYKNSSLEQLEASYDFIFDTTGTLSASKLNKLGNEDAKYATTGFSVGLLIKAVFSKSLKMLNVKSNPDLLNELKGFIEANDIKPTVAKEWTLDNIRSAHKDFEQGIKRGKTLIKIK